jgi:hypothetical protein
MGANLSSTVKVDTSKDIIAPEDALNNRNTLFLWLGSLYAIAMIWSTVALVDRWRGPQGDRKTGLASVLAAIFLSIAWPVVMVFLIISN